MFTRLVKLLKNLLQTIQKNKVCIKYTKYDFSEKMTGFQIEYSFLSFGASKMTGGIPLK